MISPRSIFGRRFLQKLGNVFRAVNFAFQRILIHRSITHISGPTEIDTSDDGVVVLCLVKNAELVIEDFITYYQRLGIQHFVFLDNGSIDHTVELASKFPNVTVLRSTFPFRNDGDMRMREYLINKYGYKSWSLCVDIDEYFDYPSSDFISLKQFIGYLNQFHYTAVVTYMLDMFPVQLRRNTSHPFDRREHRYYLLDNLVKEEYRIWNGSSEKKLHADSPHVFLTGGIRKALFGATPSLTKHALIFRDASTRRDRWGHLLDKGRVADVSSVLLHYKFTSAFFNQVEEAVKQEFHFKDSFEYKQYYRMTKDLDVINFPVNTACGWQGVDRLIDENFISSSQAYDNWVRSNCKILKVAGV